MEISEILKLPYRRILIPDEESGTFTAMIAEFPGCISEGDTPAEAYEDLEEAAAAWLEAAVDSGVPIPEPDADEDYSGRVVLRMPRSTHRQAVAHAAREGVSLNTFLVAALSEKLGRVSIRKELTSRHRSLSANPSPDRPRRSAR